MLPNLTLFFVCVVTFCLQKNLLFYILLLLSHTNLINKKMDTVDIQAVESKLSDVTVTPIPMTNNKPLQNYNNSQQHTPNNNNTNNASIGVTSPQTSLSKYAQLLNVIEEMGKEVRPTYAGSRSSTERLKRSIVSARILVRECLIETERSARQ